jgi:spore coat protein CotH
MPIAALTMWFLLVGAITMVLAQTDPPPRPDDRPGPRLGRFDTDGNNVLDTAERAKARQYLRQIRPQRRGRGSGRFDRVPGGSGREPKRGPWVSLSQAKSYADASLYDPTVLRTLFLEFETEDWEAELEDFYRTGVEVPARLTVDSKVYPQVGVRFRGHSSFTGVSSGMKRSLNISIDHGKSKQRLYGYKTVELLNSFADPSFLRVVLFAAIARNYLPSLNANLVKVVINGESWGLYVNSQQFNTDFLDEWFGTRKGVRWKVPVNMDGFGSLAINGADVADYKPYFQLKTGGAVGAWQRLMKLCQSLNATPTENLETRLDEILNLDRALWFIAIDNVLIDNDGYISRGSDYAL